MNIKTLSLIVITLLNTYLSTVNALDFSLLNKNKEANQETQLFTEEIKKDSLLINYPRSKTVINNKSIDKIINDISQKEPEIILFGEFHGNDSFHNNETTYSDNKVFIEIAKKLYDKGIDKIFLEVSSTSQNTINKYLNNEIDFQTLEEHLSKIHLSYTDNAKTIDNLKKIGFKKIYALGSIAEIDYLMAKKVQTITKEEDGPIIGFIGSYHASNKDSYDCYHSKKCDSLGKILKSNKKVYTVSFLKKNEIDYWSKNFNLKLEYDYIYKNK